MSSFFSEVYNSIPSHRLELLADLLSCDDTIHFWIYSQNLHLVRSDSTYLVQNTIFKHAGCMQYMGEHFQNSRSPVILSSHLGLMWGAAVSDHLNDSEDDISYIVIGPVLSAPISVETLQKAVHDYEIDLSWRKGFINMMQSIPIIAPQTFFQYVLMLHYCASGEKLNKSHLAFQESKIAGDKKKKKTTEEKIAADRSATYRIEQELLENIRNGNLGYSSSLDRAYQFSNGIRVLTSSPLQQSVISAATFTSLCARAAIEGGLSPDTAYSVGDSYIQSIIDCRSFTELRSINHAMYDDFIHRVHRHRHSREYSGPVQSCMEYIEMHPESILTLEDLSHRLGYTPYYLSHKFKEETGTTMKNYIKNLRLEKAKTLLITTDYSVARIAEMLHFCSSSYFASQFRKNEGILPQDFRMQKQRL